LTDPKTPAQSVAGGGGHPMPGESGPPTHNPALHRSGALQELLSLQKVPFGFGGLEHPVAGLQTPTS